MEGEKIDEKLNMLGQGYAKVRSIKPKVILNKCCMKKSKFKYRDHTHIKKKTKKKHIHEIELIILIKLCCS